MPSLDIQSDYIEQILQIYNKKKHKNHGPHFAVDSFNK